MGKKIFDFCGALLLLVAVLPFMLVIAMWIKATSHGPVIFKQVRLGYRGKPFIMFKFRTLRNNSARQLDMVLSGDDRITAAGKFLRKTHMDELPQLVNVLVGQMSLVGPRPRPLELEEKCTREIPAYAKRYAILPGLTGLEQVRGRTWSVRRGRRRAFRLDLFYLNHRSVCLDMYILGMTFRAVLRRNGV
jgi:lipopolysaccharide/colanic/teichoic acid biosynthesis glycosyltransferase